jgi:hypothetical protein
MTGCDDCDGVRRRTYEVSGDGDGVEFLVETAHLIDGGRRSTSVIFHATGVGEPRPRRADAPDPRSTADDRRAER